LLLNTARLQARFRSGLFKRQTKSVSVDGLSHLRDTRPLPVAMGLFGGATATQVLGNHGGTVGQPLKGAPSKLGRGGSRKMPPRVLDQAPVSRN